jgi:hypothetical protein
VVMKSHKLPPAAPAEPDNGFLWGDGKRHGDDKAHRRFAGDAMSDDFEELDRAWSEFKRAVYEAVEPILLPIVVALARGIGRIFPQRKKSRSPK